MLTLFNTRLTYTNNIETKCLSLFAVGIIEKFVGESLKQRNLDLKILKYSLMWFNW